MRDDAARKSALVLSGGGAYGAYEVGVIKALFEGRSPSTTGTALDPDIFAGASVGGFNAAVLAMNDGGAIESARWIDEGFDVVERVDAGEDVPDETMQRVARVAGVISRRQHSDGKLPRALTVHRYCPSKSLGSMLGMLNFCRASVDAITPTPAPTTAK